jgi:hypothetical protein
MGNGGQWQQSVLSLSFDAAGLVAWPMRCVPCKMFLGLRDGLAQMRGVPNTGCWRLLVITSAVTI